ncbi:hypothetical protein WJX72_012494 [[Myrmecia] bisecta]|uniref:Glycosyl transferase family WbsX n=1 Tax=[Myrmecia] bisecta TaxID=41462 RepID=A0AAW1P0Z4_9CHLO
MSAAGQAPQRYNKKLLAAFFPQFHAMQENDARFGPGYTDFDKLLAADHGANAGYGGYPLSKPAERHGTYDLTSAAQRQYVGELAQQYGVYGFSIYHYWFAQGPVMHKPLELMLQDGFPDIPFNLAWANEDWVDKWSGKGKVGEVRVDAEKFQVTSYNRSSWQPHLDWMMPYFKHPNYIRMGNKPLLLIYHTGSGIQHQEGAGEFDAMLNYFQATARAKGFEGLHIVQFVYAAWNSLARYTLPHGVDGMAEFTGWCRQGHGALAWPNKFPTYMRGVSSGFDNTPRYRLGGGGVHNDMHPGVYRFLVAQQLAKTAPGGVVLLNAWNEWGEGAVLEPSNNWGRRFLEALAAAVETDRSGMTCKLSDDGYPVSVPLPPAGVAVQPHESTRGVTRDASLAGDGSSVCICVLPQPGAAKLYNMHQTLHSLAALDHQAWVAHNVVGSAGEKLAAEMILVGFSDQRLRLLELAEGLTEVQRADVLFNKCAQEGHRWVVVMGGQDWYTPDAFSLLPSDRDMVVMNYYSKGAEIDEIALTNDSLPEFCCVRFNGGHCVRAFPQQGLALGGGILFNLQRWVSEGHSFVQQAGSLCGQTGCSTGSAGVPDSMLVAAAEYLVSQGGWSFVSHGLDVCAFHQNPNPHSCALVGGVYYDTLDATHAGCYEINDLPLPLEHINWPHYMQSEKACVCANS